LCGCPADAAERFGHLLEGRVYPDLTIQSLIVAGRQMPKICAGQNVLQSANLVVHVVLIAPKLERLEASGTASLVFTDVLIVDGA
jgi:hypothetical protein